MSVQHFILTFQCNLTKHLVQQFSPISLVSGTRFSRSSRKYLYPGMVEGYVLKYWCAVSGVSTSKHDDSESWPISHSKASARASGSSICCGQFARAWLGRLADQHVVGRWGCADANTEQRIERGVACSAPIEAE